MEKRNKIIIGFLVISVTCILLAFILLPKEIVEIEVDDETFIDCGNGFKAMVCPIF